MSNNRMYLVHEPTGFALLLGKRLEQGYSVSFGDMAERLERLYDLVGYDEDPDGFSIAYEHAGKTGRAWSKIEAVEAGIYRIEF